MRYCKKGKIHGRRFCYRKEKSSSSTKAAKGKVVPPTDQGTTLKAPSEIVLKRKGKQHLAYELSKKTKKEIIAKIS